MTDWNSTVFATVCGLFACPTLGESAPLPDASALYRLHYTEEALTALESIEEETAAKSALHGRILLQLNRPSPALPLLEKGAEAPHLRDPLCKDRVRALRLTGQVTKARDVLQTCPKDRLGQLLETARLDQIEMGSTGALPAWRSLLKKRLKGTPFAEVRMGLVQGLEESGQRGKAHEQRKQLAIRWPHTPEGRHASTPEVLSSLSPDEQIQHAARLWDVRLYDEAYAAYARLLQHPAQRDEAHLMMGRLLSERKRTQYNKAIQHFQACSKARDRTTAGTCLYKLGIAWGKVHEYEQTIETLRRFRRSFPDNRNASEAGFEIGRHLMESGKWDEASRHIEQWVKTDSSLRDKNKFLWFAAWAAIGGNDTTNALRLLEPLTRSGRTLVGDKAMYWKGRVLLRSGDASKAEEVFRSCLSRYPYSYYAFLSQKALETHFDRPTDPTEFTTISPRDQDPWNRLQEMPNTVSKALQPMLDLVLIGEMQGAQQLWKALQKKRAVRKYLRTTPSMKTVLESVLEIHYRPRKEAFKQHRAVRRELPNASNLQQWRSLFPRAYQTLSRLAAEREGIPEYLVYAHMLQESRYGTHMVSGADARGVLQILPSTARKIAQEVGVAYSEEWLFDAGYNIRLAAWYLGALNRRFLKQTPLASASYNGGPLLLDFIMDQYPNVELIPLIESMPTHQARNYVRKVMEHLNRYLVLYGTADDRQRTLDGFFPVQLDRGSLETPNF